MSQKTTYFININPIQINHHITISGIAISSSVYDNNLMFPVVIYHVGEKEYKYPMSFSPSEDGQKLYRKELNNITLWANTMIPDFSGFDRNIDDDHLIGAIDVVIQNIFITLLHQNGSIYRHNHYLTKLIKSDAYQPINEAIHSISLEKVGEDTTKEIGENKLRIKYIKRGIYTEFSTWVNGRCILNETLPTQMPCVGKSDMFNYTAMAPCIHWYFGTKEHKQAHQIATDFYESLICAKDTPKRNTETRWQAMVAAFNYTIGENE